MVSRFVVAVSDKSSAYDLEPSSDGFLFIKNDDERCLKVDRLLLAGD